MGTREQVAAEALTWWQTPYHEHGRIKGIGVDCAMLLAEIFEVCGCIGHVDAGNYATQWHLHRDEEQFLAWVLTVGGRELPEGAAPALGDIALFRYGHCYSHGAILVNADQWLHAYIGRGAILTRLSEEPLHGRPVRFFSLW